MITFVTISLFAVHYANGPSKQNNTQCEGYSFGTTCEFCAFSLPECQPDDSYTCNNNATHKYMGERCTFVCVTGGYSCNGEDTRCIVDESCTNVKLYKNQFIHKSSIIHSRRRILHTDDTHDNHDDNHDDQTKRSMKQWSVIPHDGTCAVADCAGKICDYVIDNTLTCNCGPNVVHALYRRGGHPTGQIISSCDPEVMTLTPPPPDLHSSHQSQQSHNPHPCPIGHYLVGGFFCAKQFSILEHDRIVTYG